MLAATFVGLNIMDAALTVVGMSQGGVAEVNPIMRGFLGQPGRVFWVFKIGVGIIFALLLLLFAAKYPQSVKRIFILLVIFMSAICLFNGIGLLRV